MKRYGRHLAALLAIGATFVCVQSASAADILVDNTLDLSGQTCTPASDGDCSLRSAVETAQAQAGHDDIGFNAGLFDGGNSTPSTIDVGSSILIQSDVSINGGDCNPGAGAKPCVGLNSTGGSIALYTFTSDPVSISGLAIWGTEGAAVTSQSVQAATVKGSWFGVHLDGVTVEANENGISFNGADGGTIGGTTVAERNVFAASASYAIGIANSDDNTVQGNQIGVFPGGASVPVEDNGYGMDIFGTSSDNTIGGPAANAGQCDGGCNLIVNQASDGVRFNGPMGYGSGNVFRGNFIGLGADGVTDQGNGGRGISLGDSAATVIGGDLATERNYIAGNGGEAIFGVGSTGADNLVVQNNYLGLSADGETAIPNAETASGSNLLMFGDGNQALGNRFGGGGARIPSGTIFNDNVIGVGPGGENVGVTLAEPGLQISGSSTTVSGNTIGNMTATGQPAVYLEGGASSNILTGNFIGTTSTGVAAPNVAEGILLGGANALTGNVIGGSDPSDANYVSNSGTDAIAQDQAGNGNRYEGNFGKNNGSAAGDLFIDLGSDGFQNPPHPTNAVNDGIQPPAPVTIGAISASGAAGSVRSGAEVAVYATYTGRGDVRKPLGYTTATLDGSWSLGFPPQVAGQCIAVQQTDAGGNSSELSTPVTVGGGACVLSPVTNLTGGPAEGSTTNDPTPTFTYNAEAGATVECRIDGDPTWAPCPPPSFTTPALDDGIHGFHIRATSTPFNPALGTPETGVTHDISFYVDTTGPTTTFTSGPAQGATITTSSTSIGFDSNEAGSTFECSVDGGAFTACTSPRALTGLSDGAHSLAVRATDGVANVGPVATRSFTVNTTVPAPPATQETPAPPAKKKCKKPKKKGKKASASAKCKKAKKKK